jgi:hypothetical protein
MDGEACLQRELLVYRGRNLSTEEGTRLQRARLIYGYREACLQRWRLV